MTVRTGLRLPVADTDRVSVCRGGRGAWMRPDPAAEPASRRQAPDVARGASKDGSGLADVALAGDRQLVQNLPFVGTAAGHTGKPKPHDSSIARRPVDDGS